MMRFLSIPSLRGGAVAAAIHGQSQQPRGSSMDRVVASLLAMTICSVLQAHCNRRLIPVEQRALFDSGNRRGDRARAQCGGKADAANPAAELQLLNTTLAVLGSEPLA